MITISYILLSAPFKIPFTFVLLSGFNSMWMASANEVPPNIKFKNPIEYFGSIAPIIVITSNN